MPRPNPPRKRPRRRPPTNQRAARADAALTKQTADSTQSKSGGAKPSSSAKGRGAVATVITSPDELWDRRSYAILLGVVAVVEVFIGILLWGFAIQTKDLFSFVVSALSLSHGDATTSLIALMAACLLAAPVAKRIAQEQRSLRIVETLVVGVVLYFAYTILLIIAGVILGAFLPTTPGTGSSSCNNTGVATPLPTTSQSPRPSGTPCPSPSPNANPTPSPTAGATASPSPSATTTATSNLAPEGVVVIVIVVDILAFVLTYYIYPPLYKRLHARPPPRGSPPGRGRPAREAPAKARPAKEEPETDEPESDEPADDESSEEGKAKK
jgi:hypothetical protein